MSERSDAPGKLQDVRELLNTLRRPHDSRELVDDLGDLGRDEWQQRMRFIPYPSRRHQWEVRRLRGDVRAHLGEPVPDVLTGWLAEHPVTAVPGDTLQPVHLVPVTVDTIGVTLALILHAAQAQQWARLKACPDCQHVFYDHSRNRSRTWCGMYAGTPDGRACGSIAKVRAYRQRHSDGPSRVTAAEATAHRNV